MVPTTAGIEVGQGPSLKGPRADSPCSGAQLVVVRLRVLPDATDLIWNDDLVEIEVQRPRLRQLLQLCEFRSVGHQFVHALDHIERREALAAPCLAGLRLCPVPVEPLRCPLVESLRSCGLGRGLRRERVVEPARE